jgi:hypothetical protein
MVRQAGRIAMPELIIIAAILGSAIALALIAIRRSSHGPSSIDDSAKRDIFSAIVLQNIPLLRQMLQDGADPNQLAGNGMTPLCHAAALGVSDAVALLLAHGADPNRACNGRTALHVAAIRSHGAVVRILLDNGADPHAKDGDGETPFHLAYDPATSSLFTSTEAVPQPIVKPTKPREPQQDPKAAEGEIQRLIQKLRQSGYDDDTPRVLGRLGNITVGPLVDALADPSESVRWGVAAALCDVRDPKRVEPLIGALKDKSPKVRRCAVVALGDTDEPRIIDHLIAALRDPKSEVWEMAAAKLAKIGTPRALEAARSIAPRWRDWEKWDPLRFVTSSEYRLFIAVVPEMKSRDLIAAANIIRGRTDMYSTERLRMAALTLINEELARRGAERDDEQPVSRVAKVEDLTRRSRRRRRERRA